MGASTCLQCGASVAGFQEVLFATRSLTRPMGLSRSLIHFHEKGPPTRLGPLPMLSSSRFRVSDPAAYQGISSIQCQATAAAPPGLREKVHRSVSSESSDGGAASLLPYSILLEQGPREEMEDEAVVVGNAHNGFVFAGVYDGHSGSAAVNYLRDNLHSACIEATASENGAPLATMEDATAALEKAFLTTDAALLKHLASISGVEGRSGSTGTVAFVGKDTVVVGYVGDSRAVLCRGKGAVDLSGDHRPYGKAPSAVAELKRLKEAGCWVNHGRVCGTLAVSRAFGDPLYKNDRHVMLEEGLQKRRFTKKFVERTDLSRDWVTARPDVTHTTLTPDDQFVILASDGLWDTIKSQEAVQFVLQQLEKKDDLQFAAQELAKFALRERGSDNISIVLIDLR
eukprot:TRINITY_DN1977_c0_g1_i1.p1 TRINITY_DN1977_c0_g1~~TRINITY_DN1977_c0_g1_i1.p1  ORF type:complete len:398 (+),score=41.68 TRINITY_DN1977_c0_g1_i1:78-1271(+)